MDSRKENNWRLLQEVIRRNNRAENNRGAITRRNSRNFQAVQGAVIGGGGGTIVQREMVRRTGDSGNATEACSYKYDIYAPNAEDPIAEFIDPTDNPHQWTRWSVGAYKPADFCLGYYDGGQFIVCWCNEIQEVAACEGEVGYVPGGGDTGEGNDLPPIPGGSGDGTTNYITFTCSEPIALNNQDFAISMAFNATDVSPKQYLSTNRGDAAGAGFKLWVESGTINFQVTDGTNSVTAITGRINSGAQYNIVAIWNAGSGTVQIDIAGASYTQTNASLAAANLTGLPWEFGRDPAGTSYFAGAFGNVRLYNSTNIDTGSLVNHWPMDDGEGTNLQDIVGDCDGTVNGDPWWGTPYIPPAPENNPPTAITPNAFSLPEGTNTTGGVVLGTLTTTDPDAGDTHSYQVVSGSGFYLAGANNDQLLYDGGVVQPGSHDAIVRTTDQGGLSYDQNMTLTITDVNSAPTNISPTSRSYADATDTTGGVIAATLSITDPDVGDTHNLTLTGGPDLGHFTMNGPQLIFDDGILDYATKSQYDVTVRATDQGGLWVEKNFRVLVLEPVNQPPTNITPSVFNLDENIDTTGGVVLGTLTTTDPDVGDTHSYSILAGGDSNNFSIGGVGSDELIFDDGILDYEAKPSYGCTVRTTDQGGLSYDKGMILNVNDLPDGSCQDGCEVVWTLRSNSQWDQLNATYDPLTGNWTVRYLCVAPGGTSTQPSGSLISVGTAAAVLTGATNVLSWDAGSYTGKATYANGEEITFTGTSVTPVAGDTSNCAFWSFEMSGSGTTGAPFSFTSQACV